ncbi:hypothetical protein GS415_09135 [Rhodococcus hoagii]|nr:hypothetical protein [Prescottella equi]
MTGRALVITRLSSVAMNIGTEAATMASQDGYRPGTRRHGSRFGRRWIEWIGEGRHVGS